MGDFSLNAARGMMANALNDPYTPGKVDKFEAIEIKETIKKNGGEASASAKAFLADQVSSGRFDAGGAAVIQDLFSAPTMDFNEKVVQQAKIAIDSIHESIDYGFFGGASYDNTVSGSENPGDASKMAETYLGKLKELSNDSSNLESIIDATLSGGKMIKNDEKRLNSYLTALTNIKSAHTNNDKDMKRLAGDAIKNIHTAVHSRGGVVMSDNSIGRLSSKSLYSGAWTQLDKIRDNASDPFIRNQADNGLDAASRATSSSYQAATNIILKTLEQIAGDVTPPSPPQGPAGQVTVETTVNVETTIKQ